MARVEFECIALHVSAKTDVDNVATLMATLWGFHDTTVCCHSGRELCAGFHTEGGGGALGFPPPEKIDGNIVSIMNVDVHYRK